jgi:hypothetical protein
MPVVNTVTRRNSTDKAGTVMKENGLTERFLIFIAGQIYYRTSGVQRLKKRNGQE